MGSTKKVLSTPKRKFPRTRIQSQRKKPYLKKIDLSKELAPFKDPQQGYRRLLSKLTSPQKVNKILQFKKRYLGKSKKIPKSLVLFPGRRQMARRRWNRNRGRPAAKNQNGQWLAKWRRQRLGKRLPMWKRRQNMRNRMKKNLPGISKTSPTTNHIDVQAAKALIEKLKRGYDKKIPESEIKKIFVKQPTRRRPQPFPRKNMRSLRRPKFNLAKELALHRQRNKGFKQFVEEEDRKREETQMNKGGKRVVIGKSKHTPKRLLVFPRGQKGTQMTGNRRVPTRRRWQGRGTNARKILVVKKKDIMTAKKAIDTKGKEQAKNKS